MRRCNRPGGAGMAAVLLIAALVCGCTGTPSGDIDLAALDTGAYGVEPLEVPENDDPRLGRILESVRMAEALVDPAEVDPVLRSSAGAVGVIPLPTPVKVASTVLAEPIRDVLERHGMVAGVAVTGADKDFGAARPSVGSARVLLVTVLRFPDPAAAQRAAVEIDAVDAAVNRDNVAVSVPEYPGAHAHWRPGVPTLAASNAHESYVVNVLVGDTTPDAAVMSALAAKAFDAQIRRLREFVPTPPDSMAALPLDPEALVRRLIPQAPRRWEYPAVTAMSSQRTAGWEAEMQVTGVTFGPRATYLLGRRDRPPTLEATARSGFNQIARHPDPAAARIAFDRAVGSDIGDGMLPVEGPVGVPDVHCAENPDIDLLALTRFVCRVLYDRYSVTLLAREVGSARQRAAAQYGLLVNGDR
ncbi:DUF7373 family lipoprotein [Nocardia carnea]|uniref:DUF7373 family lipoprotein n=1 Tax=Nocardia carnea TaxID=37328 RepID=UPI0024590F61|nr:hypothetical protein [Nocardia carnea]